MGYRSLRQCVDDLQSSGQLLRISEPIDANLEAAEIQRRVFEASGPAILFENVVGCQFPMVSNLFGTIERARYLFRDTLQTVRRFVKLKIDPSEIFKKPSQWVSLPWHAIRLLPKSCRTGPVLENQTTIDQLPQLVSWPNDGGAFITLPQVYTENPDRPGIKHSNLGMYRVQLSGGKYLPNEQVGMHYQIHRGIGVHHAAAIRQVAPLRVNIFIGGPPAMTLAAVMPLPEDLSELSFAGVLGGRRIRMITAGDQLPIHADADFCITGTIQPNLLLPEGPFGDHLGYYSLAHDFPVLKVEKVYHRSGAIWPFTVVGRPPQEDTFFGQLIHEITGPIIPSVLPGVKSVHAVDASGVHPLLLAIGSERYTPYAESSRPQELLTQASAILGQGQLSLAKYLLIVNQADHPELNIADIASFFTHLLQRVDWKRDLHFHTSTTIDTLDYTGTAMNQGSKLVIACCGPPVRKLPTEVPSNLTLPEGFSEPKICLPGLLAVQGKSCTAQNDHELSRFCEWFAADQIINQFPLIVIVDDADFTSKTLSNFLWTTFTRSNPAADIDGIESSTTQKHWGCKGSLVIDARRKPHHAPPLEEDPAITKKVDQLASLGGPLHGVI